MQWKATRENSPDQGQSVRFLNIIPALTWGTLPTFRKRRDLRAARRGSLDIRFFRGSGPGCPPTERNKKPAHNSIKTFVILIRA